MDFSEKNVYMNFTYNLYYFKINVPNYVIEGDVFIAVQYIYRNIRPKSLKQQTDKSSVQP